MKLIRHHIELEIERALEDLQARGPKEAWTEGQWTRQVKNVLFDLGRKRGFKTYASSCDREAIGEWLFDVTWTEEADESGESGGYILRVPLVAEVEWTVKDASDDFQKLLVARADHRLMVLNPQNGESPEDTIRSLIVQIDQFSGTTYGDRYLFGCWAERPKRFEIKLHVAGIGTA